MRIAACAALIAAIAAFSASAESKNGFDLSGSLIPPEKILQGGPPRDGIPAVDYPKFAPADEADFLAEDDQVLGIVVAGVPKAYPISILNWHEIVNDESEGTPFVVTYCPLCGSGVAFAAESGGTHLQFGVSGLLYNSDVLLYDRETETLWSQLLAEAVAGQMTGERLERLPLSHTTWGAWRGRHPDTLALTEETGVFRDYDRDPYSGYGESKAVFFPVDFTAPEKYHPKEVVLGVDAGGVYKAYPYIELDRHGAEEFVDEIGGERRTIRWDSDSRTATAHAEDGTEVPAVRLFWFAWYAFHPETLVFSADG